MSESKVTIKEEKLQLLQTMLMTDIQILETRVINQLQNKLQSLQMQTLKFIDIEIETLLFNNNMYTMPEIDKKARDSIIQLADSIMDKTENLKACVLSLLSEYELAKLEQQPSFKELLIKERDKVEVLCEFCKQSFISEPRLQRHINNKHRWTVPCSVCKLCFQSELVAWVHEQIVHTGYFSTAKCHFCKWIPCDNKVVRKHLMQQHFHKLRKEFIRQFGRNPLDPPPEIVKKGYCPSNQIKQIRERFQSSQHSIQKRICALKKCDLSSDGEALSQSSFAKNSPQELGQQNLLSNIYGK